MTATEKVIQLRTEVARLMGGGAGCGEATVGNKQQKQELDDKLARLGVSLRPLHPDIEDAEMASYFTLVGAEGLEDEQVLAALRDLDAVLAAYAKPPVELA